MRDTYFFSKLGLSCLIVVAAVINGHSQFADCYAPANWSVVQVNGGNGSVNASGAPANIVLTGPNSTGSNSYTHYSVTVAGAGTITFNWNVAHSDGGFDGFGYSVNGVNTQLTAYTGSGSASVSVNAGDIFTFYGHSFDGCCGTFNATITNFTHPCCFFPTVDIVNDQLCVGDGNMTTLTATSNTGGTVSWDNGISNGTPFMPPMGTTIYTVTSTSPQDCPVSVPVSLTTVPTVTASVSNMTPCSGTYVVFTGGGATTYSWDNGIVDGVLSQVNGSGTTTYTVTGTTNGCSDQATIDLNLIEQPVVNAMASQTAICKGDQVTLTSSGNATSYSWGSSVSEGVPLTPEFTTTYNVIGTNSFGCATTSGVTVVVNNPPVVNAGSNQVVCEGSMITLSGSGADTYTWSNGVVNNTPFMANEAGIVTYTVTGTDVNGCEDTDIVQVEVKESPAITATVEHEVDGYDGSIQLMVTGGSGTYQYDWSHGYDDDYVWGLTAGDYTVDVNDGNCTSDSTFTIMNILGLESGSQVIFTTYPNPTAGELTILCDPAFEYTIADLSGRVIDSGNGSGKTVLSLADHADGTYLVTVYAGDSVATTTIIKE